MKLENYELPARALAAALTHAGKKDARFYLNAVLLDFPKGRIVGTDGSRMFIGQIPKADCAPILVPRKLAETVGKATKKDSRDGFPLLVSVDDSNRISIKSETSGASFAGNAVEGRRVVQYERVVCLTPSGEVGQFNVDFLRDARDALAIYAGKSISRCWPHVAHNGTGACLITDANVTAFAVVMPTREGDGPDSCGWFTGKGATT